MKKYIVIFVLLFSFTTSFASFTQTKIKKVSYTQSANIQQNIPAIPEQNLKQGDRWGVFLVNFAIGSIGAYTIYGIVAGIVSAGLTYFIYNGEKKAFVMGLLGGILGIAVGLAIRLATV